MAESQKSGGDCIQVALRVRPLVPSEVDRGSKSIVTKTKGTAQVVVNSNNMFTFNHAFSPDESQEVIYTNAVKPMVAKLIEGYNVTILAYGQTGSGKTHTMGTNFNEDQLAEDVGIIPRAINEIFDLCENLSSSHTYEVTCSFIELYQETLYDLLSPLPREQSAVDIHIDQSKNIYIANLTEKPVTESEEAFLCLVKGSQGRAVGATAMNATSSRSHAIFTINVRLTCIETPADATNAKFHLVDLAGSERSNKTKATGQRFKEGVKINQGLLALGNVISSLGSGQSGHISYRDSKLTRLLQDSLGGNSVTLMIACVSPADYNMDETLSTLRYADRAKQIKNKAIVNMDPHAAEIKRLTAENNALRLELIEYRTSGMTLSKVESVSKATKKRQSIVPTDELNEIRNNWLVASAKNDQLSKDLNKAVMELTSMSIKYYAAERANEELQVTLQELRHQVTELNETFGPESCPAEFLLQGRAIAEMKRLIFKANDCIQESEIELNKNARVDTTFVLDDVSLNDERDIEFRSQQIDFHKALNDIQQQIRLKTEVSEKVLGSSALLGQFDAEFQDKIVDYETKIQQLEIELNELKNSTIDDSKKAKVDKISAKLAEERRQKVKELEAEIKKMQKKSHHQEMMLKQQEQYKKQVVVVQGELVQMKRRKVELVNKIKEAKDAFLKEKAVTNKEMVQLKAQQRKAQTALAKKVMESDRERNVAKSKLEKFMAVNKRLKDTLDKQSKVQNERRLKASKQSSNTDLLNQVKNTITNEIDVIYSLVDAKQSLQQMIEDRGDLHMRMLKMKNQSKLSVDDANTIAALAEDIAVRNAQIDEMNSKIELSNVDGNVQKAALSCTSLAESREAIKVLFEALVDLRILFDETLNAKQEAIAELEMQNDNWQADTEKYEQQLQTLGDECNRMRDIKNEMEREYEEKISMLLFELNRSEETIDGVQKESQRITDELIESMRNKIVEYESRNQELEQQMHASRRVARASYDPEAYIETDDEDRDPDWVKTPLIKDRRRRQRVTLLEDTENSMESSRRRQCNCKGDCHSKICGCRKIDMTCDDGCGCDKTACVNQTVALSVSNQNDSKTFLTPQQSIDKENVSPNKRNMMEIDATITPYPYEKKKKRPLLD